MNFLATPSHRTSGTTRDCKGCRYWSEMIAQSRGGRPVEAMCLAPRGPDAPHAQEFVAGSKTCAAWKSGYLGAVDEPGSIEAYAAEPEGAASRPLPF